MVYQRLTGKEVDSWKDRVLDGVIKGFCTLDINVASYSGGSSFKYQFEDRPNWFQNRSLTTISIQMREN
jgi:hypothetical protein